MAMTGDPIVAYPNTLTGSIGVIFAKFDIAGLYDKLGVTRPSLDRGKNADLYAETEPLTGEKLAKIQQQVEAFYAGFLSRVARGRKRSVSEIEPLAQGRVWTGAQAKENGLVDQLGGLDTAVELIRKRAKIGASEKITLVVYPPKRSLLEVLMARQDENANIEMKVESKLQTMVGGPPLHALAQGGFLELMPYSIRVQ